MPNESLFLHKLELLHEFCKLHGIEIWGATANGGFQIQSKGGDLVSGDFVTLRLFNVDGWEAVDRYSADQLRASSIPRIEGT